MPQITSRVSDELEAALNRWATEESCQRSDLVRHLLAEAVEARRQGRATFDRPQLPGPSDIQHLAAKVSDLTVELERVLRHNVKREAGIAAAAKTDAVGVSEARASIIGQLSAELHKVLAAVMARLSALPAEQAAALAASPAMTGLAASLKRLEEHPGLKEMRTLQEAHTIAVRTLNATIEQARRDPRVHNSYSVFGRDWTGRMAASALFLIATISVGLFLMLAMVLPPSWLALRTANQLLGGGDQAICALVDYRTATDGCRMSFEGRAGRMVVSTKVSRP